MKMYIMRGASGSGKSTRAREIADGCNSIICSADQYFMDIDSGEYKFNPKLLGQAHAWCMGKAAAAIELDVETIIIDNTSTMRWEFAAYLIMAKHSNYEVIEEIVGKFDEESLKEYAERNLHSVPLSILSKQAKRFEF